MPRPVYDTSSSPHNGWKRVRLVAATILILTAFALGGSSAGHPVREMILQLVALAAMLTVLLGPGLRNTAIGVLEWVLLAGLVALFVAQAVPLPFSVWAELPGRDLAADIARLSRTADHPRPLTFNPEETAAAGLSLLPGVAAFLLAASLGVRHRLILGGLVVVGALFSLLLGILQFAAGARADTLSPFVTAHVGQPLGLFANVNHQASLMLLALVLSGCVLIPLLVGRTSPRSAALVGYGLAVIFAAGAILLASRMVILLLPVAILAILLNRGGLLRFSGLAIVGALGIVSVLALLNGSALISTELLDGAVWADVRYSYWGDVLYGIQQFSWAGTGAGTFEQIFPSVESLEVVSGSYLNHAHNEYLEILFETGAAGVLLFILFMLLLVRTGVRLFRSPTAYPPDPVSYAAFTCVLLLMGHSIVDYPVRTGLLMTLFGLFCGMLLATPSDLARQPRSRQVPEPPLPS